MSRKQTIDRSTIELLVLAAWAHEEISIGRAIELLGWNDTKIKEQAEKRVSNAVKLREERDRLESEVKRWKHASECSYAKACSDIIKLFNTVGDMLLRQEQYNPDRAGEPTSNSTTVLVDGSTDRSTQRKRGH